VFELLGESVEWVATVPVLVTKGVLRKVTKCVLEAEFELEDVTMST
jgi:hypothetical protein